METETETEMQTETVMEMEMEMEGNGCLSFEIVVMAIFQTYLLWGICILVERRGEKRGTYTVYLWGNTILKFGVGRDVCKLGLVVGVLKDYPNIRCL